MSHSQDHHRPAGSRRSPSGGSRQAASRPSAGAPAVLPRCARRRILWGLTTALMVCALAALLASPALMVRHVRVRGLALLTPEEAAQTLSRAVVPPRTNLLRAPARAISVSLRRLPWVADARVARRLPDTLEVTVRPRLPVARLVSPAGAWELDGAGRVIRPARAGISLPEIADSSPESLRPGQSAGRAEIVGALSALASRPGGKPIPVAKIEVDQNADICLNMRDSVVVRLGQVEDLPAKLALVRRIYEDPGIGAKVQAIDLRCPEAPACVPRAAATETSQDADSRPTHLRRPSHRAPLHDRRRI